MKNKSDVNHLSVLQAIRFLSKYIRPYKTKFFMFYIGWLVDKVLVLIMPIMFGIMIDEIVYYKNVDTFMRISLVVLILSIFSGILYFFIYSFHHYLMNVYTFGIKRDVFNKMQSASPIYMSDSNTGDIINIIQKYTGECLHFVIRNIIHNINNVFAFVFYITYSFIINWQVGVLMIITSPIAAYVTSKYGKKIRGYSEDRKKNYGLYIGWLYEMLSGLKDIRLLNAKRKADNSFIDHQKKLIKLDIRTGLLELTANNIVEGVNLMLQLCIFGLAAYLSSKGSITIGSLTVILAYFTGLKNCITYLSKNYMDAQMRLSYIQHIYDFMNISTEDNWPGKKELNISEGNIKFKNIEFSYKENNKTINNFSLEIHSGEHMALVGKSGCGKTTIAYTMIGFYRPQIGEIEIDGQLLSECSLKSIRKSIGVVQQDVLIFNGSIRENLLIGNHRASEEDIIKACEGAEVWDFIKELPDGLDTVIGKKGINLSGGQKQRIAIARIYLKNPKIIIFDEATSSLDAKTEEQIHKSWTKLLKGRTSIIIAHRQSSVMLCDRVTVMDNGQVVEIGTPDKMVENSDIFKSLFAVKEVADV